MRAFWCGVCVVCAVCSVLLVVARPARADDSLERDAAEYRSLRKVTDRDARKWGGRKHAVMTRLGEKLGDGRHTVPQLKALMGEPDRVALPDDDLWRMIWHDDAARKPSTTPDTRLLVYEWRGGHDFLYFICDGIKVRTSGWWMALE